MKMLFVIFLFVAPRASVLTGLRPNPNRFKAYDTRIDIDANDVPTVGNGSKKTDITPSVGKISHHKNDSQKVGLFPLGS